MPSNAAMVDIEETLWTMLLRGLPVEQPEIEAADYPSTYAEFIERELGMRLTEPQRWICDGVERYRRVSAASCHASGKTAVAAGIAVAFLHIHANSRVITTAASQDSVREGMWQEIRSLYERAPGRLLGKPSTTRWEIAPGWVAQGIKPADNRPGRFQGRHAGRVLIIVDEAIEVAKPLLDGLESLMTGELVRILYLFNPTQVGGPAYDTFHAQSHMWHRIKITAFDTPNVKENRTVVPGMIDRAYVDEQIALYGEEHDLVQARVYAEFPKNQDSAWVPIADIERAEKRQREPDLSEPIDVGVDVARTGSDKCVVCVRQGETILGWFEWRLSNLMESAGRLQAIIAEVMAVRRAAAQRVQTLRCINIDETGLGAGLADRLQELQREGKIEAQYVTGVNFAGRATDSERCHNVRQELWTLLRDRLREDRMATITGLGLHKDFIADVTGAKIKWMSGYPAPQVESKDDMKKRLGRSPDYADGTALAFYLPPYVQRQYDGSVVPTHIESGHTPYPLEEDWSDDDD